MSYYSFLFSQAYKDLLLGFVIMVLFPSTNTINISPSVSWYLMLYNI